MRLLEIQKMARKHGIKDTWKHSKKSLIRAIQLREGNFDCFASKGTDCDQLSCLWKKDCLTAK